MADEEGAARRARGALAPGRQAGLALARSALRRYPPEKAAWHYEHGLLLMSLRAAGKAWGDAELEAEATRLAGLLVRPDGSIEGYRAEDFNLDQVNPGKNLFDLPDPDGRYRAALDLLASQLDAQPRTASGGYWHKLIYPDQMWLDGLYMAQPFRARYAALRDRAGDLDDVVRQFELMESRARDPRTGLLYHGWDESRRQLWANPETGCSPCFWGRAVGWFAMALVDCLEWLPRGHRGRDALRGILRRLAAAVVAMRDAETGLWYQVLDQGGREGDYLEASASAMLAYALAKGAREGALPEPEYGAAADAAVESATGRFLSVGEDGEAHLGGTCSVAGLGGEPYRDGSFAYYVGEPRKADDYKGVGAFILASVEYDRWKAGR
jgi:unsaturated rhamnogalacturonyl hydrolase